MEISNLTFKFKKMYSLMKKKPGISKKTAQNLARYIITRKFAQIEKRQMMENKANIFN